MTKAALPIFICSGNIQKGKNLHYNVAALYLHPLSLSWTSPTIASASFFLHLGKFYRAHSSIVPLIPPNIQYSMEGKTVNQGVKRCFIFTNIGIYVHGNKNTPSFFYSSPTEKEKLFLPPSPKLAWNLSSIIYLST